MVLQLAVRVNPARPNLLEESDHARTSRSAVDPDGQRSILGRAIASLEEPPEDRLLWSDVHIARERLDARSELADAFRDFFVADSLVVVALGLGEVCWHRNELGVGEWEEDEGGDGRRSRFPRSHCCVACLALPGRVSEQKIL
jgi:hypothetical protein